MWQVVVRDRRTRRETRVGPKMGKEYAEMFCQAIRGQISAGNEHRWSDPVAINMTEGIH
ncbi:MAG: hypothetical protein ACREDY_00885 [Bradyrhizobium sp.]